MEPGGELSTVEEFTLLGLDGSQRSARGATDALGERGTTQGTVLLSLRAIGGEGIRKDTSRGSRVSTRSVINGLW